MSVSSATGARSRKRLTTATTTAELRDWSRGVAAVSSKLKGRYIQTQRSHKALPMIRVKFGTFVWSNELRPCIVGQHLQIAQLAPFVYINQELTQFAIVLVE